MALREFLALDQGKKFLLLEATLWLGVARCALVCLPFKSIAPHLGEQKEAKWEQPGELPAPPQAHQVATAVERMSNHTFWESACLAQAIAGKMMLRRRGIASVLYLGTKKDATGKFMAHSWLKCGGVILLGGIQSETFAALIAYADSGKNTTIPV